MVTGGGHGEKVTRKQELVIAALLVCRTAQDAAKATGVGVNTVTRWMRDPTFQAAYREARQEAVREAVAELQKSSGAAVRTLCRVMDDGEAAPSARVAAARAVLEGALRASEMEALEGRIAELEARLAAFA